MGRIARIAGCIAALAEIAWSGYRWIGGLAVDVIGAITIGPPEYFAMVVAGVATLAALSWESLNAARRQLTPRGRFAVLMKGSHRLSDEQICFRLCKLGIKSPQPLSRHWRWHSNLMRAYAADGRISDARKLEIPGPVWEPDTPKPPAPRRRP